MTIEQVIARSESTPFRAERLRQARKRLAQRLYGEDLTLKSLRMRAGLSQAKVAEMIGTSQSHIARVESGSDALMIDTCRKLCHALNVDMNTLDKALTNSQHLFTTRKK
jgi:DNA-binding XRE family transcriptional regulator